MSYRLTIYSSLCLVLFLVFVIHGNVITNGLVNFDDETIVAVDLPRYYHPADPFLNIEKVSAQSHYYRPLPWAFWIGVRNFVLADHLVPALHVLQLFWHALNAFFVLLLAGLFFDRLGRFRAAGPLLTALLFVVHPINTEVVAWIAAEVEAMMGAFVLFALYAYMRFRKDQGFYWLIASVASFNGALFSKETAIAFLPLIILHDLLFIPSSASGQDHSFVKSARAPLAGFMARQLTVYGSYLLLVPLYFYGRWITVVHWSAELVHSNWDDLLWRVAAISGFYFKKIILPEPMEPFITEVQESTLLVTVSLVSMLCIVYLVSSTFRRSRVFLYHFLFFAFLLLPALSVAVVKVSIVPLAERYLYVPGYAFCFLVACAILHASKALSRGRGWIQWTLAALFTVGLLVHYAQTSHARDRVWSGELRFWSHVSSVNPDTYAPQLTLASFLFRERRDDEALSLYQWVAGQPDLRPENESHALKGIGLIYAERGDYVKAGGYFEESLAAYDFNDSHYYLAKTKLSLAMEGTGDSDRHLREAHHHLSIVKKRDPDGAKYILLDAEIAAFEKKYEEAISILENGRDVLVHDKWKQEIDEKIDEYRKRMEDPAG